MLELLHLKIHEHVANYLLFGSILLNDETGSQVIAIHNKFRGKSDKIILKILLEWIEGKGLPVTWESLVKALRNTRLSVLADQIQASKIHAGGKKGERKVCS